MSKPSSPAAALASPPAPPHELLLLLTLAGMQFTNILDFMIMMPLAPQLMRLFDIGPQEFGFLVSAYTFAAAASGFVAAFSLAAVMGVPLGLWIAAHYSWRAPFLVLAALSILAWIVAWRVVPPIDAHLRGGERRHPVAQLHAIFGVRNHRRAFAFMIALMTSVFMVVPFIAAYNVANVGLAETDLPYIYFAGGLMTLFTAQVIGRLADRFGKKRLFTILAVISVVPLLVATHLPPVPFVNVLAVTVLFFVFVPGRFGPAMALVTGSVAPPLRGSFMSFNGAIQQLGSGLASLAAGLIIGRAADGSLTRYGWAGWCAVAATLVAIVLANRIRIVPDGSGGPD